MREIPIPDLLKVEAADTPPRLLLARESMDPLPFNLAEGDNVIGRGDECAVVLSSQKISRRHCRVRRKGMHCEIEDLGSTSGTMVNGILLTGRHVLSNRDQIMLGPVSLEYSALPKATEEQPPDSAERKTGTVRMNGHVVEVIPLSDGLVLGRGTEAGVELEDPAVSRRHVQFTAVSGGFKVIDLNSRLGSLLNGHPFAEEELVLGDRLQTGVFHFRFEGRSLRRVPASGGATLTASALTRTVESRAILDGINVEFFPRQFVGILGPSGAGKTTLLDALSGLCPAEGKVLLDGIDLFKNASQIRSAIGYVPQEDIVHGELTVREALLFSARLRLPKDTPHGEIHKLVNRTIQRLGLEDRAELQVQKLSGGQRKRVSVGVELLAGPQVLFLDEPTSGLDPAAESRMMELLRRLADNGCTVICTTHLMENVHLMDRLVVVNEGRIVSDGSPDETKARFGIQDLHALFANLDKELPPLPSPPPTAPVSIPTQISTAAPVPSPAGGGIRVLLERHWAVLRAEPVNFAVLFGQPLLIGGLVSWVTKDASLILFFAYIATLWFGCGNGAQEIVREKPIYCRERLAGLGRWQYLLSKFGMLTAITAAQGLLLYLVLIIWGGGLAGSTLWQLASVLSTAAAAVAIGLAISAAAKTPMQAVLIVPLVLIPQILFSGYTVPAHEMRPSVAAVAPAVPAFAAQRAMDVSLIWDQRIARDTLNDHWTAFRNLNRANNIQTGDIYRRNLPGSIAILSLWAWVCIGLGSAARSLSKKERS